MKLWNSNKTTSISCPNWLKKFSTSTTTVKPTYGTGNPTTQRMNDMYNNRKLYWNRFTNSNPNIVRSTNGNGNHTTQRINDICRNPGYYKKQVTNSQAYKNVSSTFTNISQIFK